MTNIQILGYISSLNTICKHLVYVLVFKLTNKVEESVRCLQDIRNLNPRLSLLLDYENTLRSNTTVLVHISQFCFAEIQLQLNEDLTRKHKFSVEHLHELKGCK